MFCSFIIYIYIYIYLFIYLFIYILSVIDFDILSSSADIAVIGLAVMVSFVLAYCNIFE